nr:response regulator [Sulfuriferula sp. AH1]
MIKSSPETCNTRVLMLSAKGQKSDLEQGQRAGADAYLVKPFSPLELIDKVERLLAK